MVAFIVCISAGLWHFYNFITYIRPEWLWPYIQIGGNNSYMRVLNMLCLNWSPIIGGLLMLFGVLGLILSRRSDDFKFEQFKWFMLVVAFLTSVGLIL